MSRNRYGGATVPGNGALFRVPVHDPRVDHPDEPAGGSRRLRYPGPLKVGQAPPIGPTGSEVFFHTENLGMTNHDALILGVGHC